VIAVAGQTGRTESTRSKADVFQRQRSFGGVVKTIACIDQILTHLDEKSAAA
jgi:hypothetical protein